MSGETRKLMDIGEAVKNIVNANPSNFTMDLALSEVCIVVTVTIADIILSTVTFVFIE